MKKIICIIVCVVFWNCGGDAGFRIGDTTSDITSNSSTEKNRGNYPGFFESSQKPINKDDFFDGFFDRHPENIKNASYTFDTERTDDLGNVSVEKVSTSAYVNYGGLPSQVFALQDKYNVVNVHLSWNPDENYANREDLKFFLCNIDNMNEIKPIEGIDYISVDGLNCSAASNMCAIDLSEWSKGEKNIILDVNVNQYNKNVKIGLCMQYATYWPVVYDALEIKVYETQTFNVTLAHVGNVNGGIKEKIENRIKETLYRAGVEIDFTKEITYRIPEDFENDLYKIRQLPKKYLYVKVGSKGSESSCYKDVGDDLFWLRSKVQSDIGSGKNERRTAVILNQPTVKFWTIGKNYYPCTRNLEDWPKNDGFHTYTVGILNNEKYSKCQQKYPNSGNVFYGYNRDDGRMGWFNIYGQSIDDEISSYIDPECHVLVDLSRMGSPNWEYNDTGAQKYYRTLIPSGALGIVMAAQSVGGRTGLMSFNPPDDEVVFVHELTHLCGLADVVKSKDNVMYQSNNGGTKLGNLPLRVKDDSGIEQQWDCLHDEKNAEGCSYKAYRLLNF
jgi:hypothetical protein